MITTNEAREFLSFIGINVEDKYSDDDFTCNFQPSDSLLLFPAVSELYFQASKKKSTNEQIAFLAQVHYLAQALCLIHNVSEEAIASLEREIEIVSEDGRGLLFPEGGQGTGNSTSYPYASEEETENFSPELLEKILHQSLEEYMDWLYYYDIVGEDKKYSHIINNTVILSDEETYLLADSILSLFHISFILLTEQSVSPAQAIETLHETYRAVYRGDGSAASQKIDWEKLKQ